MVVFYNYEEYEVYELDVVKEKRKEKENKGFECFQVVFDFLFFFYI